jgi:hypothetical protein
LRAGSLNCRKACNDSLIKLLVYSVGWNGHILKYPFLFSLG